MDYVILACFLLFSTVTSYERSIDCNDFRPELECVSTSVCPQFRADGEKRCPGGLVCCNKVGPSPLQSKPGQSIHKGTTAKVNYKSSIHKSPIPGPFWTERDEDAIVFPVDDYPDDIVPHRDFDHGEQTLENKIIPRSHPRFVSGPSNPFLIKPVKKFPPRRHSNKFHNPQDGGVFLSFEDNEIPVIESILDSTRNHDHGVRTPVVDFMFSNGIHGENQGNYYVHDVFGGSSDSFNGNSNYAFPPFDETPSGYLNEDSYYVYNSPEELQGGRHYVELIENPGREASKRDFLLTFIGRPRKESNTDLHHNIKENKECLCATQMENKFPPIINIQKPERDSEESTEQYKHEKQSTEEEERQDEIIDNEIVPTNKPIKGKEHHHSSSQPNSEENENKPLQNPKKAELKPGKKSFKYCQKYTQITTESFGVMPLLPEKRPFEVQIERCTPKIEPLIVGGTNASILEFPHMAALGYNKDNTIEHLCGGSIISEWYVLSAAHCMESRWGPPVLVTVGSTDLLPGHGIDVAIEKVIPHPDHKAPSAYNDIGLIKLKTELKMSAFVRPACLATPRTAAQLPGQLAIATGWGRLGFGRESSTNLLKVSLEILSNQKCQKFYKAEIKTPLLSKGIAPSLMCAIGNEDIHDDTCQGDSGGPLQAHLEGNECMTQILGVTSFGKTCGTGNPGVYTRVYPYIPWIETIVWP